MILSQSKFFQSVIAPFLKFLNILRAAEEELFSSNIPNKNSLELHPIEAICPLWII